MYMVCAATVMLCGFDRFLNNFNNKNNIKFRIFHIYSTCVYAYQYSTSMYNANYLYFHK